MNNFIRYCQAGGCTMFHSPKQYMWVPSPLLTVSFVFKHLNLTMALIYIFLITKYVEHLFSCLFAICKSVLVNVFCFGKCVQIFVHFFNMDRLGYIKIKNSCSLKKAPLREWKRNPRMGEVFAIHLYIHFCNWVLFFLLCWMSLSPLSDMCFCTYILPTCGLSFRFLNGVFQRAVLKFWWSSVISFF